MTQKALSGSLGSGTVILEKTLIVFPDIVTCGAVTDPTVAFIGRNATSTLLMDTALRRSLAAYTWVGAGVGESVGASVGDLVGDSVGAKDGDSVGAKDGDSVGAEDGDSVGAEDGE